ncbi:MAG: SusC/RagA family TonB-linked outer membrane protein [Flavobacterium sp. BFFFF1]|uniref:SusC/RagA family TonB-linked outer membrane protein n=1 Tax=unclassified Flavobacterium TaxID=196869 RepID=UPI000BC3DB65|nr:MULTISPECIES: SusC/RagA family TonB-linked outer membrane protein [unclassified Flavobacterium]OYU81607.1 MAG: SusC/RagA family TonB-linked outer membrane protein [Flavobacterium sp. BFFFF1]
MKPRLTNYFAVLFVLFVQFAFAQERTVSGTVSDNNGLPLPGVGIVIKGTQTGTQTDFDGKYSIKATPTTVLVFSFIGMKTQEVVASSTSLNVKMVDNAIELEGVVVTAFGIKRNPKDLGYSVSTVKAGDLTENSEPDLIRSLNGKVPGVNVNVSSGVAGASNQITIRGISTFGNSQPLIVVDGVTYSNNEITTSSQVTGGGGYESALSSLDPNDIASVNVLKSAAASALYGSRASNGVIVITTKSGSPKSKMDKKLSINVGTGTYFENIANLPEYQNKYGAGSNFNYGAASNGSWGPSFDSLTTIPTWAPLLAAFPELGPTQPYVAHPNNVKDLFRTGTVIENTLGFNYSGQEGSFNLTISDLNQDGYIPYNTYDRTSISTGGNFKLPNGITIGGNMSYSKTQQVGGFFGENQFDGSSSSFARTLYLARNWDFNLPYEDPVTGQSVIPNAGYDHPLWSWKHDKIITNTNRIVIGGNMSYNFNDHISVSYRLGYNKYDLDRLEIRDKYSRADGGVGTLLSDRFTNTDIESTLLFNFNYKLSADFGLEAIVGSNLLDTESSRQSFQGKELILPNIYNLKNTKSIADLLDEGNRKRNAGVFADVTFSFRDYLFLNATGRNEWSSVLPKDNNSYFYPSVSTSLVLTDAFKMNSKVLTFAKLRAAYAKVAKDTDPEFLNIFYSLGQAYNGQSVISNNTQLGDQQITPEFSNEFEVGTDLEFFNRRIALDLSVYSKKTTDLINDVNVPITSGYQTYTTNAGDMTNKGVEIGLTVVPVQTKNFKWSLLTNFTKNKNEVTKIFAGISKLQLDPNEIGYAIVGEPFGVFYGTRFARDANGNYLIDPSTGGILADPELGIIGDPTPDFKMNFINTFSYKGFTLKAQVDWRQGGDISSTTIQSLLGRGVTRDTEDREHTFIIPGFYGNADGTPMLDGNLNQIPNTSQLTMNELYFSPGSSNTFAINSVDEADIYDGTVFRLREISLTYDVPKKLLEKTPFGNISFSVMGSNLWYLAPNVPKYTNYDPETTSYGSSRLQGIEVTAAPTAKRYGFKLNLTF